MKTHPDEPTYLEIETFNEYMRQSVRLIADTYFNGRDDGAATSHAISKELVKIYKRIEALERLVEI